MKYRSRKTARSAATLISLLLVLGALTPATARASVLGDFVSAILHAPEKQREASSGSGNLQTMVLPKPAMNADPMAGKGGAEIMIVDRNAVAAEEGPSGTPVDYDKPKNSTISLYTVVEGDTLSVIAKLFKVSPDTILWANDLPRNAVLRVRQTLVILPVTGVRYTVKSGDTLASIAKKFGADAADIGSFNGVDESTIVAGMKLIIPDGEIAVAATVAAPASSKPAKGILATTLNSRPGTAEQKGYYIRPIVGGVRTQGVHGYNGVDLAAPRDTPILASAAGTVLIAKETGWNAGYGGYVVIKHANGSQTLYAHMSSVLTYVGATVVQGQVIGRVGSTGKSTGAHVHFEIRNGIRNPF